MDPKALSKALLRVCSPERPIPVASAVNEYLALPDGHTSLLWMLLALTGPLFLGRSLNYGKFYCLLLLNPTQVVTDIF